MSIKALSPPLRKIKEATSISKRQILDKIICPVCKEEFVPWTRATVYCSNKCRLKQYETKKGFDFTEVKWVSLREFILERDNYTCQDCGRFAMDKGLEVHHIKLLRSHGTNDEANLITLCHNCHKTRHRLG